jgi:hypothetical protein
VVEPDPSPHRGAVAFRHAAPSKAPIEICDLVAGIMTDAESHLHAS